MRWYLDGVLISSDYLMAPSGPGPGWPVQRGVQEPRGHYPYPERHDEAPTATRGRYPGHRDAVLRAQREAGTAGGKPGAHTSAAGLHYSGAPASAVDDALRMEGLHERRDRDKIKEYLRTGGVGMDPATTAWCAAFVNSSLAQEGIKGSGSQVATSFMTWGQPATGGIQRGDVLVKNRGLRAGQTGGHVGMATGRTRQGPNGLEYEMISGNTADSVRRTWESAAGVVARRASGQQAQRFGPNDERDVANQIEEIRPFLEPLAHVPMHLDPTKMSPNIEDRRGENYIRPDQYEPELRYHPLHHSYEATYPSITFPEPPVTNEGKASPIDEELASDIDKMLGPKK